MIRKKRVFKMAFTSQEIDDLAAQWPPEGIFGIYPEEQVEFDAWLKADVRHLGAYGRAEAVLARLSACPASHRRTAGASERGQRRICRGAASIMTGTIAASVAARRGDWCGNMEEQSEFGVYHKSEFR